MDKLTIISESPYHMAVFKPHNLSVVGCPHPNLLDLMRQRFGKNIFPVHRLDRVTAGITVFAKTPFAKLAIDNAFKKRLVKKTYYALCLGVATFTKLHVNQPLKKTHQAATAKAEIASAGSSAITNLRLIKVIDGRFSLIEANPLSGRMHQIRVHLASLNLPIVGDTLYGGPKINKTQTIALMAVTLELPLPKGQRATIDARSFFDESYYLK